MLQWNSENMMIDDFIQQAADQRPNDLLISTSLFYTWVAGR
jgi:hypothetical protein